MANLAKTLTIAGSDSGGGAGIQADLKTMSALGCYGMTAITSVTVQNTRGVFGVHDLPPETVAAQMDAVLEDLGADAAKTGMLSSAQIIESVAGSLKRHSVPNIVVDPVMVAKSGDALLQASAQAALKELLLPLALVVTPNVPEAAVLAEMTVDDEPGLRAAAERIHALGPRYVLMKGGHLPGPDATDFLYDGSVWRPYTAERVQTENTHGTGCTYSAAIACFLARGYAVEDAVGRAKEYLTGAIRNNLPLGGGHGPLGHGWRSASS